MDQDIEKRLDAIVEDEVRRGFIVKVLPTELVETLKVEHDLDPNIPLLERVRFTKLTPRKRRLINEAVVKRYHKDLKNAELLSNDQLRKLNIERGEWSVAQEERIKALMTETSAKMRDLYFDGIDRREVWTGELIEAAQEFRESVEERPEDAPLTVEAQDKLLSVFDRWFAYEPQVRAEYTVKYAAEQERTEYSPDRDLQTLLDSCVTTEAAEALNKIDDLRDKLRRYVQVLELRRELIELQGKEAQIYAESVESRRAVSEEMARLYYCTEVLDANTKPAGPLTKTFEGMWDLPDDVIQWLLVEIYFFANGIPDEARGFLAEWGFIRAPQRPGSPESPDASPAEPSVKADSSPADPTPVASSASVTATN